MESDSLLQKRLAIHHRVCARSEVPPQTIALFWCIDSNCGAKEPLLRSPNYEGDPRQLTYPKNPEGRMTPSSDPRAVSNKGIDACVCICMYVCMYVCT